MNSSARNRHQDATTGTDAARPPEGAASPRSRLLSALPVEERRLRLGGVPTAVLVGGDGPPVVLLHGPGESALGWMRVIPDLVRTHRVIAPDLPAHGASGTGGGPLDADRVLAWLDALLQHTCPAPPALVGHLLGGAIAARFAAGGDDRIRSLVLVDAMGLAPFRPSLRFVYRLVRFLLRPSKRTYDRFLPHCMFDPQGLREGMGDRWETFLDYNVELAKDPESKRGLRKLMLGLGVPAIPREDLARIGVPTTLIWGRHDRALPLRIAREASDRYGWPLEVIDDVRDDAKLERPDAFLDALRRTLVSSAGRGRTAGPAAPSRTEEG